MHTLKILKIEIKKVDSFFLFDIICTGDIMKKNIYKLSNIDCASCALKIEDGINRLDGIQSCTMNFMFMKLIVNFDENQITDAEIETCIHKSLSGVKIIEKNNQTFNDTYIEEDNNIFKRILLNRRKR